MANRRRRNNARAPIRPVTMEDFMRHKPFKFMSKSTPDEADAWPKECEKICRFIECTDAHKLSFVTFLLVADAEYWWVGMR